MIAILLLSLFSELHWRPIGPIRGGRTKAAAGVPQRPGTFYIGPVNGGVFRTDDYGRTWTPIFDDQPSASIGAIAVAPSNPDIIYVGSGEGLHLSGTVGIVVMMGLMTLLPTLLLMMTGFTRILIVLNFLRQALAVLKKIPGMEATFR